jgi:alkylation response protein AidB-like acyl-CoA dehydrogenase
VSYKAPVDEQYFVLESTVDVFSLADYPLFADLNESVVDSVLREGARLTESVFAPLNRLGDTEGVEWSSSGVSHPPGFKQAYETYVKGGWAGLYADPQYGGLNLPLSLSLAFGEQLESSNLAFLYACC